MHRSVALVSVLAVLLAGAPVAHTVAQEGSPAAGAFAMPEGVAFEGLAYGEAADFPADRTGVGLFRARLEPGASFELAPDSSPYNYLIYVESGAVTFRVDASALVTRGVAGTSAAQAPGLAAPEPVTARTDVTLMQGDAALFASNPGGAPGEVRNDGQEPVVALVVEVGPPDDATPAAGTPVS